VERIVDLELCGIVRRARGKATLDPNLGLDGGKQRFALKEATAKRS
jgi:hypothetical protein